MRLRDLSQNGKLVVRGKDRVRFLNGMFTNDIAGLQPGGGCHASMLTVRGKLLGDAVVLCDADALQVDVAAAIGDRIRLELERHLIVAEVEIEDRTAALDEVGFYGDDARPALERLVGALPDLPLWGHVVRGGSRIVRVADLGLPGYRVIGGARALAAELGGAWLEEGEAEVMRVEAGVPRYGVDMGEDHLPIESRLDDTISHTKGCYLGQEVIARATARGHVNRKLCGLRIDGQRPAEPGAKLSAAVREQAGQITSSVLSPRFGPIALGYVHRTVWDPGTELRLIESGGERRAVVCELPFRA